MHRSLDYEDFDSKYSRRQILSARCHGRLVQHAREALKPTASCVDEAPSKTALHNNGRAANPRHVVSLFWVIEVLYSFPLAKGRAMYEQLAEERMLEKTKRD
jgi:hypothetical protein